jgi:hypothetical protein
MVADRRGPRVGGGMAVVAVRSHRGLESRADAALDIGALI